MTKGTLLDKRIAGTSWWRGAWIGVPARRWPSSL
jgi:hypothetical protein